MLKATLGYLYKNLFLLSVFRRQALFSASADGDLVTVSALSYYYYGDDRQFVFFNVGECVSAPPWPSCSSLPPDHLTDVAALFEGPGPTSHNVTHLTDPAWTRYPPPPPPWSLTPAHDGVRYSFTADMWDYVYACGGMRREGSTYSFDVSLNFWNPSPTGYTHSCSSAVVSVVVSTRTGTAIAITATSAEGASSWLWLALLAFSLPSTCDCRSDTRKRWSSPRPRLSSGPA